MHTIYTAPGRGAVWSFDGNVDKPTFGPSVKISSGHYIPGELGKRCWCTLAKETGEPTDFACSVCHYFVRAGRIEFCSDSTHQFAGKTVDMSPLPEHVKG